MVTRQHNFSGIPWYGHDKTHLLENIEQSFKHKKGPGFLPQDSTSNPKLSKLLGIVSPHAGYSCSGPHASHGFLEISKHKDINSVIILGTNHTGMGSPTSLFPKGEWITPLGSLEIDEELHDLFTNLVDTNTKKIGFEVEPYAHMEEHSIDNQLPFLQYAIKKDFTILPIVMGDHSYLTCLIIAEIVTKILSTSKKKILILSSSDFTHYLSPTQAETKDRPILDHLKNFRLKEAYDSKLSSNASICGFGPVLTLFTIAQNMGLVKNKILIYGHSGETCGDLSRVVAYASIILGS